LLLLPVFLPSSNSPELRATFLDVGQGTAVVIETKNHRLVYDAGRWFSERFNAGEHIIAPYLRSVGGTTIDKLIVSHSDSDHSGGVSGLLNTINVNDGVLAGEPKEIVFSDQVAVNQCYQGQEWQWDGVSFRVLWPSLDAIATANQKSNNLSCVLLISHQKKYILLTGDIEKSAEYALLAGSSLPESLDIILVPHHGSKTSSSASLLAHLKPLYAVVTAGYHNQYGHPHPAIVARYSAIHSPLNSSVNNSVNSTKDTELINTALSGAVRFTWRQGSYYWHVEKWRALKKRYWFNEEL